MFNAFARAAGAPRLVAAPIPTDPRVLGAGRRRSAGSSAASPASSSSRDVVLDQLGIPLEVLPHVAFTSTFDDRGTQAALEGTGIACPPLRGVRARSLWKYWEEHLDRDRARRTAPGRAARRPPGRHHRRVVRHRSSRRRSQVAAAGGVPILVARRTEALEAVKAEIEQAGGQAWVYSCDITDDESVDALVRQMLEPTTRASTCS